MLAGLHAAGRKTAAIADAVNFIVDRHVGIATKNEIAMQRVGLAPRNRAAGRHQRLRHHLAAKNPLPAIGRAHALELVLFKHLQVE